MIKILFKIALELIKLVFNVLAYLFDWKFWKADKGYRPDIDNHFMKMVKSSSYSAQKLVNFSESKVYWNLVDLTKGQYMVFSQVSLGEILKTPNKEGYRAVNSKRVDFLLCDKKFNPVAAIEYQGSGHYKGNSKVRDEIKRIALEDAGIELVELFSDSKYKIEEELTYKGVL